MSRDFIDGIAVNNTALPFDNDETVLLSDNEKALGLLNTATELYRNQLEAIVMASRLELVKEVAEVTHVEPCVLLYALKYGCNNAHTQFYKLTNPLSE
jgi:hypothetical protein